MRQINTVRTAERALSVRDEKLRLIIQKESLSRGKPFKLASGAVSDYYFDMKPTMLDPEGLDLLSDAILERIEKLDADCIGGLAMGAVPIVISVVMKSWATRRPLKGFWVRDIIKDHGIPRKVDGHLPEGSRVVIVDDVTTKGTSVMKAVQEAENRNCKIVAVITIVDRLEGAKEKLKRAGHDLDALYTTKDFPG